MESAEPALLTFGPVPSRRRGCNFGINHIPPKSCSHSCIYCQARPTPIKETERRTFYQPEEIQRAVVERVEAVRRAGESTHYLTFVPDGEPTLDRNLGETLELLQRFNYLYGTVVRVADDDTLTILRADKHQMKIRLAEIDAPERGQPFGRWAGKQFAGMVAKKNVAVRQVEVDRYGRTVGRMYLDDRDVNAELVRIGLAWVYPKYVRDTSLYDLGNEARAAKQGLWSEYSPHHRYPRGSGGEGNSCGPTVYSSRITLIGSVRFESA